MQKYEFVRRVGQGAYGEVYLAKQKDIDINHDSAASNTAMVAVKRLTKRYQSWRECVNLRELKALKALKKHSNIVSVLELVLEKQYLHFVFEYMQTDLCKLIQKRKKEQDSERRRSSNLTPRTTPRGGSSATSSLLNMSEVRHVLRQILAGLKYMHRHGFFHRDIKPENMLCSFPSGVSTNDMASVVVKLADFGLAREIRSRPPYTDYVATRWYRAPELVLHSQSYNSPVDVWAAGCVAVELCTGVPLLAGASEMDQLLRTFCCVGRPSNQLWPQGLRLLRMRGLDGSGISNQIKRSKHLRLAATLDRSISPPVDQAAVQLIQLMLHLDPLRRCTATRALQDPFLAVSPQQQTISHARVAATAAVIVPAISRSASGSSNYSANGSGNNIDMMSTMALKEVEDACGYAIDGPHTKTPKATSSEMRTSDRWQQKGSCPQISPQGGNGENDNEAGASSEESLSDLISDIFGPQSPEKKKCQLKKRNNLKVDDSLSLSPLQTSPEYRAGSSHNISSRSRSSRDSEWLDKDFDEPSPFGHSQGSLGRTSSAPAMNGGSSLSGQRASLKPKCNFRKKKGSAAAVVRGTHSSDRDRISGDDLGPATSLATSPTGGARRLRPLEGSSPVSPDNGEEQLDWQRETSKPASLLSDALIREHLSRRGFTKVLRAFDAACPRGPGSISSRRQLLSELQLTHFYKQLRHREKAQNHQNAEAMMSMSQSLDRSMSSTRNGSSSRSESTVLHVLMSKVVMERG